MEPSDFGRPISASEARAYIEDYKTQRNTLIEKVLPWVPDYAPQDVKDSVTFYKSKVNAFIFNADLIKPFFDAPDPAQYLAIFLGAYDDKLTVVVTGLKEGPEPNTLILSADDDIEQPRFVVDAKHPSGDNGPIRFN
jgi:lipoprotein-anchoring transpeptidase ErfK/SrfK